jgi:hypothetical protein
MDELFGCRTPDNGVIGEWSRIPLRGRKPGNSLRFNQVIRGKPIESVALARYDSKGSHGRLLAGSLERHHA